MVSPWIESHSDLKHHPKLYRLCKLSGWSKSQAIGNLHLLWYWVLEYRWETGNIADVSEETIVYQALEIRTGNPGKIYGWFREAGFIDRDGTVHDWFDYVGRLIRDRVNRRKGPEKNRKEDRIIPKSVPESYESSTESVLKPSESRTESVLDRTLPDLTVNTNRPKTVKVQVEMPVKNSERKAKAQRERQVSGNPGIQKLADGVAKKLGTK